MPNSYFQFKKFTVQQDQCAMKVCTDSCLFGAWAADYLLSCNKKPRHILDIGSGTGLLSLMLAQKCGEAGIDAVEVDIQSSLQSKENFTASLWSEQLRVYECRVQDFYPQKKYDFIISNPPFYQDDVRSENEAKNAAHHSTALTLYDLLQSIKRLLREDGSFAVLLPYHRTKAFENSAGKEGFFLHKKTLVKQTKGHTYFRSLTLFSKEKKQCEEGELSIKDKLNNYTDEFILLMKEYYLFL